MAQIKTSIRIRRSQEKVSAFGTDFRNDEKWWKTVIHTEKTTEGPIGVGTRFRQTAKVMLFTVHNELEIVEYDPPHQMRTMDDTRRISL